MASITEAFPPLRACIFDMDGLLINTESIYFTCMNKLLANHNHSPLPPSLKPRLMGVPSASAADIVYSWAQLPISRVQFDSEQAEQQRLLYPDCEALPGVKLLLENVNSAKTSRGEMMKIALASSTSTAMFAVKTTRPEIAELLGIFNGNLRILGDNPALKKGRGKPAPDIFLLALEAINDTLGEGEKKIVPAECLVFEDSVPGVEAGRRAGMRVIWVPHEDLAAHYRGNEGSVLAGKSGLEDIGDREQLGEVGDGWGNILPSLKNFPYQQFGIEISED